MLRPILAESRPSADLEEARLSPLVGLPCLEAAPLDHQSHQEESLQEAPPCLALQFKHKCMSGWCLRFTRHFAGQREFPR